MAAYAALVSLINDLKLIPIHLIHSFSFDDKQIAHLSQIVDFLIDFMETYDSHACTRDAARLLESRITSAAHAAHDVIESHLVDQIYVGSTLDGKPRSYFLLDLQKAINNMDFIKRKAILFEAKSGLKAATYSASASSETLTAENNVMVGVDDLVFRLMAMLTGEHPTRRILPIVGMGGIGKTTLARNVFEHSFIKQHFDVRIWATISQEYSVDNILKDLLSHNDRNVSELGVQLHKMLWCRRYLIVLDDMWSVEAWDEIQRFLPDNENGSCVVVTTRLSNLAPPLSSSSPFEMEFLDFDQSWKLFCGKTFGEEGCPTELEKIGKQIVKRCRGLPLSIVVIGGHLKRSSREIEYWEMFGNLFNPISGLGVDEQCMQIISLSYEHLAACLKPCFLYLGIFEEDEWIDAPQVLRFWIAEGFIKGKKGVSLEEVAEDYLNNLIDKNLILVRKRRWNRRVEKFVIHDIVRELCLKVAEKEKFLGVLDTAKAVDTQRRIVVPRKVSSLHPHAFGAVQLPCLLRSFMCQQGVWFIDELSVDLRLLRLSVILSPYIGYSTIPNFIQVNLRYLVFPRDLSIHSSIMSVFWNMQTLVINNFTCDVSVLYAIWEMTQLRHLEFHRAQLLVDPLPSVINEQQKCIILENLHSVLRVGNLRLTDDVCKRMPNIKNLKLSYYCPTSMTETGASYYCLHNLCCLNKLESLECGFGDDYTWRDVILSIVLPSSLQELSLGNCHWEDLTEMMKSLPCLGSLQLQCIRGPEWDLAEAEFPCLKILKISHCDDLVNWNANSSHFPVLEALYIWEIPKLSEIPFDIGEIPTLGRLDLNRCSMSAAVSAMRIVVEQESLGNEDLLVDIDFSEKEQVVEFQSIVQEECLTINSLHLYYRQGKIKDF